MSCSVFAALMAELVGAADRTAVIARYAKKSRDWRSLLDGATGDEIDVLQRALAVGAEHPITRAAERWLAEVGGDRSYLRLLNRPPGTGRRPARVIFPKFGTAGENLMVSVTRQTVRVFGADGRIVKQFKTSAREKTRRVAIHPDGQRILIGSIGADNWIRVYDRASGEQVEVFAVPRELTSFTLLPDGRHAFTCPEHFSLSMWDLESIDRGPVWTISGGASYYSAAPHPNGEWFVVRTSTVFEIRLLKDGSLVRDVPLVVEDPHTYDYLDLDMIVLPDGNRVVFTASDGPSAIPVVDLESGVTVASLAGHAGMVLALAISPDGKRIASAADDGYTRVWDTETLRCVWVERTHQGHPGNVCFFGDAVVNVDREGVGRLWEIEAADDVMTPTDGVLHATSVGDHVYAVHHDGVMRQWEIATGECVREFPVPESDDRMVSWYWPDRNSLLLVVAAQIYRYDLDTGERHLFHTSEVGEFRTIGPVVDDMFYLNQWMEVSRWRTTSSGTVDESTKSQVAFPGIYQPFGDRWLVAEYANRLDVLDLTAEPPEFRLLRPFNGSRLADVAVYQESLLAAVDDEATVYLFRLPEGDFVQHSVVDHRARADDVWAITFAPDGSSVYLVGPDGHLRRIAVESGEVESWQVARKPGIWVRSGRNKVAVGTEDAVLLVDVDMGEPVLRWPVVNASPVAINPEAWVLLADHQLLFLKPSVGPQ